MNRTPADRHPDEVLTLVHEGMEIFDSTGERLGTVDEVRFGAIADATSEYDPGPARPAAGQSEPGAGSLVEAVAEAFDPNTVPSELLARLRHQGFIRVDGTLFSNDRYIMPDQIDYVDNEGVHLNVIREKLISDA